MDQSFCEQQGLTSRPCSRRQGRPGVRFQPAGVLPAIPLTSIWQRRRPVPAAFPPLEDDSRRARRHSRRRHSRRRISALAEAPSGRRGSFVCPCSPGRWSLTALLVSEYKEL